MKLWIIKLLHLKWINDELIKIKFPTVGNRISLSKNLNGNGNRARLNCIHFGLKKKFNILINKNNWFDIHKDKNNKQDIALLLGLGNYTGGELITHYDNKEIKKVYDIFFKPITFKNKTIYHSVKQYKGDRYSIITYLI